MRVRVWSLAGPLLVIVLWDLVVRTGLVNPILLPGPWIVARELVRLLRGPILPDLLPTLARVLGGLGLSIVLGVPLGLLVGSSPAACRALQLPFDFYRSVPAVATIPLFVVLLGTGESAKLAVLVCAVSLTLVVHTSYGVRTVREGRRLLARSLGMSTWQTFHLVVFPESLPHVFSGLRIAVSLSTTIVVATEMLIGASSGLGRRIYDAQLLFRIPELYATIVVAGALGYALNKLVVQVERRVLHWVGH